MYLLAGGLPALFLSALCLNFGQATVWALGNTSGKEQLEALLLALVFAFGVFGTVSGWLAFFAVGISSLVGRAVHSFFIIGGVVAALLFEWQSLQIKGVLFSSTLVVVGPAIVGVCLIFHLWRNTQPVIQAGLPQKRGSPLI